jgi:CRISPR-associated protein Cas2
MRAKKNFYVIAYDVTDDKRRRKVVKLLEKYGKRSNYSVFECMVTDAQLSHIRKSLLAIIDTKDYDSVAFYPICLNCYAKISYYPPKTITNPKKIIVVT